MPVETTHINVPITKQECSALRSYYMELASDYKALFDKFKNAYDDMIEYVDPELVIEQQHRYENRIKECELNAASWGDRYKAFGR